MYKEYFGLKEAPFTISPDPRYLFMSERHRDALAHLLYGIGAGGGFVLLTGEVGTGKTTVCRCLLEQLPNNVRLAYILNPKLNAVELMATMCDELGIAYEKGESSLKAFTDLLSSHLLANHDKDLNTVLMIDEAQNLSVEVLEQIRLLTNLETNQKKLLQIILIGQPELQELLAKKELRQLAQRITARYHLRPLSLSETKSYLEHRLRIAGVNRPVFKDKAIKQIHKQSQGIPRLINVISDRSLLGAFSENRHNVDLKVVIGAADEVLGKNAKPLPQESTHHKGFNYLWLAFSLMIISAVGIGGYYFWQQIKLSDEQAQSKLAVVENTVSKTVETKPIEPKTLVEKPIEKTSDQLAMEFWGEQSWDRTAVIASKNLLSLWGLDYLPFQSAKACQFAESYSLSCDEGVADWNFLSKLNRPVNLKFHTENSGTFWGTLKSLDEENATLQFADNEVVMSKVKLNPMWTGTYRLFWKKPRGFAGHLSIGSKGASVSWLTSQINKFEGVRPRPRDLYTSEVKNWVMKFQRERDLLEDGIIGKHTVIMINSETIADIPTILSEE